MEEHQSYNNGKHKITLTEAGGDEPFEIRLYENHGLDEAGDVQWVIVDYVQCEAPKVMELLHWYVNRWFKVD